MAFTHGVKSGLPFTLGHAFRAAFGERTARRRVKQTRRRAFNG